MTTDPRAHFAQQFDEFAPTYHAAAFDGAGLAWLSDRELAKAFEAADIAAGHRVLDVGVGTGRVSKVLRSTGATVVGMDQAPAMLEEAARNGCEELVLASLGDVLPFADGEFDRVVSLRVLKYLSDWKPALDEFARVLRPGGRLVIEVTNAASVARWGYDNEPVRLVTRSEVTEILDDSGFAVTNVNPVCHLPQKAFAAAKSPTGAKVINATEGVLDRVLGTAGARSFVITAIREA